MAGVCRIETCPDRTTAEIRREALSQRGYSVMVFEESADLITATVAAGVAGHPPVPSDDPQTVTGPYIVLAIGDE